MGMSMNETVASIDFKKLKSAMEWGGMRRQVEEAIQGLLGDLPKRKPDIQLKIIDDTDHPGFTQQRVNYFVEEWDRVSAWLFIPKGRDEVPAILCCHQETPEGKDEPAGISGDPRMDFARHYAELGYATLAPDCITAGERVLIRSAPYEIKNFKKNYPNLSLWGKMLVDHQYALDALSEVGRVDAARMGVIGHGLGAANALLLSAFDERVLACVASCGFTRFETDKHPGRWASEELMLLPELLKYVEKKDYPFDWEHILSLAAPSALLIINSLADSRFHNPKSSQKAVSIASNVYKLLGASRALDHFGHYDGHRITPETQEIADDWFERWL